MRILQRSLATILIICMMFTILPSELLMSVNADVVGNVTGNVSTMGEANVAGGVLGDRGIEYPVFRVTLSRNSEDFLDGTEEQRNKVISTYKVKYPNNSDITNSLFLWDPILYDSGYTKRYHENGIALAFYTPGDYKGLTWNASLPYASLNIRLKGSNYTPTNTFKQKVLADYNAKKIGSIANLADNKWKNYLPTVDEAYALVSYIFAKSGRSFDIEDRIKNLVSEYYQVNPNQLDSTKKMDVSAGYGGLLASLYVISSQNPNRSAVTGTYITALNDYFGGQNSKEKPVSLVIDTCIAITINTGNRAVFAVPTIDFLQYSILSGTTDSITTGPEFIKTLFPASIGNTRKMVFSMAESSRKRLPLSQTYAGTGHGVVRLIDFGTPYADAVGKTALGWMKNVSQFDHTSVRINRTETYFRNTDKFGFMDLITFNNNIKGFIIAGAHIANPVPTVSYTVDGTVATSMDICAPEVRTESPSKITLNIQGDSSLISSLSSRKDDPNFAGVKLEVEIYKTEYLNGFGASNSITTRTRMPELEAQVPSILKGESLISTLQGNPIIIKDNSIFDRVYTKIESGAQSYLYKYDISLKIGIDDAVYEYKKEDIATKIDNGKYYDFAEVNVPTLVKDVTLPEDIVITKPSSTDTTEVINPSENENLALMTQMIKRYEFTSEGEEFAEIKNNEPLNENYEVMAGVPSSEELYFSVGGSEFKVAMIVQYWMNEHSRDRTYTVHFDGTDCEYNNNEKGKGDTYADFKIPGPEGASSSELNISCTDNEVSATWTVTFTPNCSSTGCHNSSISCSGYDMSQFNTAKAQADAWIAKMGNPSTSTITWTSASDKVERKGFMSGSYSWTPASPNHKSGSCTGCTCSGEDPCGSCHSGTAATPCSSQTITYTVKMTIPPHQVCGPCCGHKLPELYDTWRQGLVYDFAKISQIRLYKLDQGSVDGLTELTGVDTLFANTISGNPTYFMNIAQQTEKEKPILPLGIDTSTNIEGSGLAAATVDDIRNNVLTYFSGANRKESQSSRAGRLRYILDPSYQKSDTISYNEQGNGSGGSWTIDYNKVAAPEQHDDVIYEVGARSKNCDGMATTNNFGKSSSTNVKPMDKTGHVNEWADGCLYTNILDKTSYSGYWLNGAQYTPKELKANDAFVAKYKEDYNHHIQRDGLTDKTTYSDKADNKDIATPEWNFFNKARRTKIIVNVISDFLILQTSGGDQSLFYYEKESIPTEAQEHFQKVKITPQELFKDNPLSIFNGSTSCTGPEIKDEKLEDFIIVGGYNGQYNKPTQKYQPYSLLTNEFLPFAGAGKVYDANKHTGAYQYWGGSQVKTILDTDPAKTINRPIRQATNQATSFKVLQKDIRILPTSPNKLYEFENAKVFYSETIGFYSMDEGVRCADGATRVGCKSYVQIGVPQRMAFGEEYTRDWGNCAGVDYSTVYFSTPDGDSDTNSVNGVVIYTPVSTEDAMVLPQDDFNIKGKSISRDQRTNAFDFPNMNDLVNKLKVCPLDPELCEYRYLDCKFLHDTVLADFDFSDTYVSEERTFVDGEPILQNVTKKNTYLDGDKWITTNKVNGIEYTLPTGFTVQSGNKVGDGRYLVANGTRWSIPFGDIGLSNTNGNRVNVELDLTVESNANNLMLVSFYNYGFIIKPNASLLGSFINRSNLDISKIGSRADISNGAVLNKVHLSLTFGFNNLVDCEVTVNGVPSTVTISELRNTWVTDNGVRKLQQIQQTITDFVNDAPKNLSTGAIGTNLNIGSWGSDAAYAANYYVDNLKIILKGGTLEHNSTCYEKITVHAAKRIHVHDENCYLKEDVYTCDGTPNANYQLGCNNLPLNYYGTPSCGYTNGPLICGLTESGSGVYNCVASDDDSGGNRLEAYISYNLTRGQSVKIQMGGYRGGGGSATLTVNGPDGLIHNSGQQSYSGYFESSGSYKYEFVVLKSGNYTFRTSNRTNDPYLGLYVMDGHRHYPSCYHYHTGSPGSSPSGCYTVKNMHIHSGTVGLDSVNGCYTKPTEHKHTSSCEKLSKGSLVCTGELNTTTDYNSHVHTTDCLTTNTNLDKKTFMYTGSVQTYVVPWTDYYTIEAYGSTVNNTTGYVSGKVKLKKDTILYISVGSQAGYNKGISDVRLSSLPLGYRALGEDLIWDSIKAESDNSRLFIAGKGYASSSINSLTGFTITNQVRSFKGNSGDGRVIITPANTNSTPILDQIVNGTISLQDAEKYLGPELYNSLLSNSKQVLHTWSGWSTSNDKGFKVEANVNPTYTSGKYNFNITGSDPRVTVKTELDSKAIVEMKIYFNNNTNSTKGKIYWVRTTDSGSKYNEERAISYNMLANTANQVVSVSFKDNANWNGIIGSLRFDFADEPNPTSGSVVVNKIELIGFGSKVSGTGDASYINNEKIVATAGTIWNYDYTGSIQTRTLEKGKYKFEVYGAQGNNTTGGKGGYSYGTLTLSSATPIYIGVGGQAATFNGGGTGNHGQGGGATHIALASGQLSQLSGNKSSVLIVAGGGGGSNRGAGGYGGGANASGGTGGSGCGSPGTGGTLSSGGTNNYSNVSTSYGGTTNYDGSFGLGGSGGRNSVGGGGGYYGGGASYEDYKRDDSDDAGGGGGSGYVNTSKFTNIGGSSDVTTGNGKAKITALEDIKTGSIIYNFTPLKLNYVNPLVGSKENIIDNADKIPDKVDGDYNPIWACKFATYNTHVCESIDSDGIVVNLCTTRTVFRCSEPHHRGEHYSGSNKICWSACCDDDNHKNTKTETVVDAATGETVKLAEFLQLDAGFTIYFPNRGNFYGNNVLGLASPQITRGKGYTDNMDTTQWTREKRVKFPFDVIFEDEIFLGGSWIELDVPTEYFNFYLLASNSEVSNAKVEFEVEAINCGTGSGTEVTPSIKYSDLVSTEYATKLTEFRTNYLNTLLKAVKSGYKVPVAQAQGANNTTAALPFGDSGLESFYIDKQKNNEEKLRKAINTINKQIESDFEGNSADGFIDPHTKLGKGINHEVKPITPNDNKQRVDNKMRSNSLESLHGGYKSFYLDVIGRIGNFSIADTEDYRFSNFFKTPIISATDTEGLADPTNWLVEGLILKVDDSIQNLYIGDLFDIRGNSASPDTRWLDTYGTQSWMTGQLIDGERDITKPNLKSQILTGNVNNIAVLKDEELRFGYDAYTSIVTLGSYQDGKIQAVPKYYALKITDNDIPNIPDKYNVSKGTYIPLDVYINKDGLYSPVNVYGNAGNGEKNKGNLDMYDYVFNLDWTDESNRRNYTLEEKARTLEVCEYLKTVIYDIPEDMVDIDITNLPVLDVLEFKSPKGRNNPLGTSQYILMDATHRTFIGSPDSYGGNIYTSKAGTVDFGTNKNKNSVLEDIKFYSAIQRWHGKLGLPSSSVFVPTGVKVNTDSIKYIMNDDFAIICTAETVAVGNVWSIYYSQPWFDSLVINGESYSTAKHYPGHRINDGDGNSVECPDCLPPIIAVYSSNNSSIDDVEIVNTH